MLVRYIFLAVITLIFALLTVYVGRGLISRSAPPRKWRLRLWALLLGAIFVQYFGMAGHHIFPESEGSDWMIWASWLGFVLMGFFALIFLMLVFRDALRLIWFVINKVRKISGRFVNRSVERQTAPADPSRRQFLARGSSLGIVGLSGGLTLLGAGEALGDAKIEKVNVALKNLPQDFEGFRIVQLSDLHVGPTLKRDFVEMAVKRSMSLKPDMIVITGDLADGRVSSLKNDVAPLADLEAPSGKYFVMGNHDYFYEPEVWLEEIERLGFKALLNEGVFVRRNASRLFVAGVNDYDADKFHPDAVHDPLRAAAGAASDDVKILLAHQPRSCFKAAEAGFDLQLSGHTHGGQFFPWKYLVYLQQPYLDGLNRYKNLQVYTNRGTGYWGPPLRLAVPAEISEITVTKAV